MKSRRKEAHPAQTPPPNNYCPMFLLNRDALQLIFAQLPKKDAVSLSGANRRLYQIHGEWLDRKLGLINDEQKKAAFATQQNEIEYLLNNKAAILLQNANHRTIFLCFERLEEIEKSVRAGKVSLAMVFHLREELLNQLNGTIIRNRIARVPEMDTLNCSQSHLTRFPGSLFTDPTLREYWSRLTFLHLNENQITTLPQEIGRALINLMGLDLDSNQLNELPPEIGQLRELEYLYLESNRLTNLTREIWKLRRLKWLKLDHNQLTALPPEIGLLETYTRISLEHNQLTALPDYVKEETLWHNFIIRRTKAEVLATQILPQVVPYGVRPLS